MAASRAQLWSCSSLSTTRLTARPGRATTPRASRRTSAPADRTQPAVALNAGLGQHSRASVRVAAGPKSQIPATPSPEDNPPVGGTPPLQGEGAAAAGAPPNVPAPPPSPPLTLTGRTAEIGEGLTQITVRCDERFAYEVDYSLNKGTMENTYLIKGSGSTALVGLPDNLMADTFTEALSGLTELSSITHVVMPHFGPKRLDTLLEIISQHPKDAAPLQILCGNAAVGPLREALSSLEGAVEKEDFDVVAVRGGSFLDVGGQRLYFTLTPTPRWPDLFCSYHQASETLLTGKLFSSHLSSEEVYDTSGWDVLQEDWNHFFQCTLAASAKQSLQALQKLQGYQLGNPTWSRARVVRQLAPMHGVVVRSNATELVREYREWTEKQIKAAGEATVAVIYASAYGNTTALAQAIARGVSKAGVGVESLNCEMASPTEVKELLKRSNGFALGSPTLGGHMPTPVQEALGAILQESSSTRSLPCGVFGSFGWSGEAVDMMHSALKDSGFSFSFDPIRCKFKPTLEMLQICEESGTDLAQAVLKEKRKKNKAAGAVSISSSATEKAVGRLVGSMCVVTTDTEDASSAMLASWVSQASFNPPGVTVAVAKERAVEGLLTTGSQFALSVLAEGHVKGPMKQLLKPFKPGEDRFADYEVLEGETTGMPVIPEAAAYIECTVESRMETGDHWIMYATVNSGKVLSENALTAIHHRKAGTSY